MDEFTTLNLFGDEEKTTVDKATVENDSSEEAIYEPSAEKTTEKVIEVDTAEKGGAEECPLAEVDLNEKKINETEIADKTAKEATQSDNVNKLLEGQNKLLESINALNSLFNARIMHTDHEEKVIDQMCEELQRYKKDMYSQLVRPILLDVIEVRDSIMRMSATYLSKPEGEQAVPIKTFSDYSYDLQDILENNSVEIFSSKTGDDFTPIKQRVIKKVETDNENLHGKVADSLSCGYSYNGKTISAEKITIYYYEKTIQENKNSEVIENG